MEAPAAKSISDLKANLALSSSSSVRLFAEKLLPNVILEGILSGFRHMLTHADLERALNGWTNNPGHLWEFNDRADVVNALGAYLGVWPHYLTGPVRPLVAPTVGGLKQTPRNTMQSRLTMYVHVEGSSSASAHSTVSDPIRSQIASQQISACVQRQQLFNAMKTVKQTVKERMKMLVDVFE